jgi:tetratricopeptide (TPR) repeat protein
MKKYIGLNSGWQGLIAAIGLLLSTTSAWTQQDASKPTTPPGRPLNEQATTAAWDAYNSGKYEVAITNAEYCIEEFRGAASILQTQLEKEKPNLPTGAVSEEMKQKIQANGLLNDVATCCFIKGRAAEKLGRKQEALKAYEMTKKFTYARAWDPQGWYWSPAEAADGRIATLR